MKFTDFNKKNISNDVLLPLTEKEKSEKTDGDEVKITEPLTKEPAVNEPLVREPKIAKQKKVVKEEPSVKENKNPFTIKGKTIKFPNEFVPSQAYKLLETKKVSKDDVKYILIEKDKNIVILKYNENSDFKLKEFSDSLLNYYKKSIDIKDLKVEGNNSFSIFKNIPDGKINEKIQLDLMKLLK
jgi:hypothetical protein